MMIEDSLRTNFCTTRRAAQLLGVSVSTVQKYCESGLIEMHKSVGGHRRISVDSLNDYIMNRSHASNNRYKGEYKLKAMLFENDPKVINEFEAYCFNSDLKIQCVKLPSVFEMMVEILEVNPKIILISLDLSEFDGCQFAKSIGKYVRIKNTMVILTSNKYYDLSEYVDSLNGRVVFVQKPIPDGWFDGYFFALKIQKYFAASSREISFGAK